MNEKKDFLEWYVVEQTLECILLPGNIEAIANGVVAAYDNEFNDKRIRELERKIRKLDIEVDNLVMAIATSPPKASVKLTEKIEVLENQKADIELNLVTLRIANARKLTKKEIVKWLKSFCRGDNLDKDFQRRIIDIMINAVYLYDDKVVIYYNLADGKQVSYIDMCDDLENLIENNGFTRCYTESGRGSDNKPTPPLNGSIYEPQVKFMS